MEDMVKIVRSLGFEGVDENKLKGMLNCYSLLDCTLVWIFDQKEKNAAKFLDDNLLLLDHDGKLIWRLAMAGYALASKDCCVSVSILNDKEFAFATFNGLTMTYDVLERRIVNRGMTR